jgi:hypothetical protein
LQSHSRAQIARFAPQVRPPPSDGLLPDDHINITTGPYPDVITVNNVRSYQFDYVVPMEQTQHQMFQQTVEPLIQYVLEGENFLTTEALDWILIINNTYT